MSRPEKRDGQYFSGSLLADFRFKRIAPKALLLCQECAGVYIGTRLEQSFLPALAASLLETLGGLAFIPKERPPI